MPIGMTDVAGRALYLKCRSPSRIPLRIERELESTQTLTRVDTIFDPI